MGLRSRMLLGLAVATVSTIFVATCVRAGHVQNLEWSPADLEMSLSPEGYLRVEFEGAVSASRPGSPDLPWIPVTVPVDADARITSWSFEGLGWERVGQSVRPRPRADESASPTREDNVISEDPAAYGGVTPFPQDPIGFRGVHARAGVAEASFVVSPFRWDPVTGDLEMARTGTIRFETTSGPSRFLPAPLRTAPAPKVIAGADAGSSFSRSWEAGANGRQLYSLVNSASAGGPSLEGNPVEFLIITTEDLAPGFEELIEWKNQAGYPAEIRTTDWIYANYPQGVDQPEKIRLFLRDAYRFWGTRTVLIGGDPLVVPGRYGHDYSWNFPDGVPIITDYYYACLDGNWNANGNARYGEPPVSSGSGENQILIASDLVDFRPELRVGRIPANDLEQVNIYMQKYMEYAVDNPPSGDYIKTFLAMGEVLFESDWQIGDCDDDCQDSCPPNVPCVTSDGAEDCISLIEQVGENPAEIQFNFVEMYERDYWWNGLGRSSLELGRDEFVSKMNGDGANLIFHAGHGDRDRWATGKDRVDASDLFGLTNATTGPGYAGFVYAINCNSAAIDFDCAAEAFQFAPSGGGLIYIGSTNLDFPAAARRMQAETFARWPGDGTVTPGDAYFETMDAIAKSVGDSRTPTRFLIHSLTFLGDPDMFVWTESPSDLVVEYDAEFDLGSSQTSVTVRTGSTPVENARVALWKKGEAMAVAMTGSNGSAVLEFLPASVGEFTVTVTGPNLVPFRGSGQVVGVAGNSFVATDSFEIDDVTDEKAGISGNGNGVLEVGEVVGIDLNYSNRGAGASSSLTATLTADPVQGLFIEVLTDVANLPGLEIGGTGTAERAFIVSVEANGSVPSQATLPMTINWNDGGLSHNEALRPKAYSYDLVAYATEVIELEGDGDGIPEGRERFQLSMEFLNFGEGEVRNAQVRLQAVQPARVAIEPAVLPLSPAGKLEHSFTEGSMELLFLQSVGIELILSVEDVTDPENPRVLSQRLFDLVKPDAPAGLTSKGFRDRIALGWSPSSDIDLYSYRVYRSATAEGPFDPIGVGLIPRTSAASDTAYYSDESLPPLTNYFYKVAIVDSSGNESDMTEVHSSSTAPGFLNGWPVLLNQDNGSAPVVEQLDNGPYEVIFGTDVIYAFTASGGDYYDGDGIESTRGVLTVADDGYLFSGRPAVFDIDADGTKEILAASRFPNRDAPREIELVCFDNLGRVKWRRNIGGTLTLSPPAIGDIDGDLDMEVVILAGSTVWGFHHDGRPVSGTNGAIRTLNNTEAFFLYGGVGLADVYDDGVAGAQEIMFTTRINGGGNTRLYIVDSEGDDIPNFPFAYSDYGSFQDDSNASPAIADIVSDGGADLGEVFITSGKDLWAIDPNASDPHMWHVSVGSYLSIELNSSPAIGDINDDGNLDVVVGGADGRLFALNAVDGTPIPNFGTSEDPWLEIAPASTRFGSPVLGDVSGDDHPEILIGDNFGNIHAIDHTGTALPGFPYQIGGRVGPGLALWDVDKNGTVNLVVQTDQIQTVTVLDFPGTFFDNVSPDTGPLGRYPWTQFRHDTRNAGNTMTPPITPLALGAPNLRTSGDWGVELRWIGEAGFAAFELYRKGLDDPEWTSLGARTPNQVAEDGGGYLWIDQVPNAGTFVYRLVGIEPDGYEVTTADRTIEVTGPSLTFALAQPRPNPSRLDTEVQLTVPRTAAVDVRVIDPGGRVVRTLHEGRLEAGSVVFSWDGRDDAGRHTGAGIYFVQANAEDLGRRSTKLVRVQ